MTEPRSTVDLCMRIANEQDSIAFRDLFARHYDRACRVTALRSGRLPGRARADIEDAVQEAFFYAWQQLVAGKFDASQSEGGFRNWIGVVAANKLRDSARRKQAIKRGGGREQPFRDMFEETVAALAIPAQQASPSSLAGLGELGPGVEGAILEISERHRRAIDLRFLCEMSFDEIAGEFGLRKASSARALVSRAIAELRAKLPPSATA